MFIHCNSDTGITFKNFFRVSVHRLYSRASFAPRIMHSNTLLMFYLLSCWIGSGIGTPSSKQAINQLFFASYSIANASFRVSAQVIQPGNSGQCRA